MVISTKHGFRLCKQNDFYWIVTPSNDTMTNASGTKNELISELERWKKEIDSKNSFMLEVENHFLTVLRLD